MIMFFRRFSESFIARILMALICVSMISVFGISGMTGLWGEDTTAIRVGKDEMHIRHLAMKFDNQLRQLQNQAMGRSITPDQAMSMGLLSSVVAGQVQDMLTEQMTNDFGVIASDDAVRNYIVNHPNFQTVSGKFDHNLFITYLKQMGKTEAGFTQELRDFLAKKHIYDALSAVMTAPELLADKVYFYENQAADFDALFVRAEDVKIKEKPTTEELKDYYDMMTEQLYAPEYRTLTVLKLTPDNVGQLAAVSDSDIKQAYEENKAAYITPEKRDVKHIFVSDTALADEIKNNLKKDNFDEIASSKAEQTADMTNLGLIARSDISEELGDAVFTADKNQVVGPVETAEGFHFALVTKIEPEIVKTLDDVKEEIKKSLQAEQAYDLLYEKHDIVDEKLAAGEKLSDAAAAVGLMPEGALTVDVTGTTQDGRKIEFLPELLEDAFSISAGETTMLIEDKDGFVVAEVSDVIPMTLRKFDDVQKELKAEWLKDKQISALSDFASDVYAGMKKDGLKAVSLFYNLKPVEQKDVRRMDMTLLDDDLMNRIFKSKKGEKILLPIADYYAVVEVKDIKNPEDDEAVRLSTKVVLDTQMAAVLTEEALTDYANKLGVEINQALIDRTFAPYVKEE